MFERFSRELRQVVKASVEVAQRDGRPEVAEADLLLAVAEVSAGAGAELLGDFGITGADLRAARSDDRQVLSPSEVAALRSVGVDAEEVLRRMAEAFGPDALTVPASGPPESEQPARRRWRPGGPFSRQAKQALELSLSEAVRLGDRSIGTEHLLLALLRLAVPGPPGELLRDRGVSYEGVERRLRERLSHGPGGGGHR